MISETAGAALVVDANMPRTVNITGATVDVWSADPLIVRDHRGDRLRRATSGKNALQSSKGTRGISACLRAYRRNFSELGLLTKNSSINASELLSHGTRAY
jgi:hypothetical protein